MKESNVDTQNSIRKHDSWGAEAFLFKEQWFGFEVIKKVRSPKKYRIKDIDIELRNSRTITESKLLIAAKKVGVKTPSIFEINLEDTSIIMENIDGVLVKEWLKNCDDFPKQSELVKLMILFMET